MQIAYDAISDESCRLRMALKAALEPKLINDSKIVHARVSSVALTGMCTLLFILDVHDEKGKPRSLAKEKSCRLELAVKLTLPTMSNHTVTTVRMLVPMFESGMAVWKTYL